MFILSIGATPLSVCHYVSPEPFEISINRVWCDVEDDKRLWCLFVPCLAQIFFVESVTK